MKKLSKITESIWSDMQDRSAGITQRKEDDVNLMSREDFCDYLNDNYIIKDGRKIMYNEFTKNIFVSIFATVAYNIAYDYKSNTIIMNDDVESFFPELCKAIKENFKVDKKNITNPNYTQFIISPSDGSKCTNRFFVDVINFIIDNADENELLLKKKHINESIWSDMQDRSAGKTVREEDMITTNNGLRNKIQELYKEQGEGETLDVSSLTKLIKCDDFAYIFSGYENVKHIIGLEDWDVSNVENMEGMFWGCKNFNYDLSKWDVSKVKSMKYMFSHCENFKSNLSKWNVSNVKNMHAMFFDCKTFNSDLSKWDVSKVENMGYMFKNCDNFNSDLSNWDVSSVRDMECMFWYCKTFNSDLSNWNVSNGIHMKYMFSNCESLKQIPSWYKNK